MVCGWLSTKLLQLREKSPTFIISQKMSGVGRGWAGGWLVGGSSAATEGSKGPVPTDTPNVHALWPEARSRLYRRRA